MDGLNRSARAPRGEFAELISDGLILWRLSATGQSDLWCLVFEHPNGLCFVLDDDPEGTQPQKVYGEHHDIVGLVNRTEALKAVLLRSGWSIVDVE
jgi:hypothetical protein